jgi:CrcB protein
VTVVLAIILGAAIGAPARYVVERRLAAAYPYGTLLVNVVGSAVLGALAGWAAALGGTSAHAVVYALVGVGFCGSLTTFGGYAAQVLDLAVAPDVAGRLASSWRSLGYATVSVLGCVGIAALAYVAARAVAG